MTQTPSREDAIELDNTDEFRAERDQFTPLDDVIYLCGNSLGPMPNAAAGERVDQCWVPFGMGYYSPRDVNKCYGQLSPTCHNGYALMPALIARNGIGGLRQPDVVRFGIAPLCLRYVEIQDAADPLTEVLQTEKWKPDRFNHRSLVT